MNITTTDAGRIDAILSLHEAAFPEEDLRPLVRALMSLERGVLALGAFDGDALIGHAIFTECDVVRGDEAPEAGGFLLGPLAVAPDRQRRGIGGALVREGFARLEAAKARRVFVLGDPAYYGRFGFTPERDVRTPYPIPEEWTDAWRSAPVGGRAAPAPGVLSLPSPWMEPRLWA